MSWSFVSVLVGLAAVLGSAQGTLVNPAQAGPSESLPSGLPGLHVQAPCCSVCQIPLMVC